MDVLAEKMEILATISKMENNFGDEYEFRFRQTTSAGYYLVEPLDGCSGKGPLVRGKAISQANERNCRGAEKPQLG